MDQIGKCATCSAPLYEFSSRYECCHPNYIVCIGCHFKNCPKCQRQDQWRKIVPPQCKTCLKKLSATQGIKEMVCGAHFCARCLSPSVLGFYLSGNCPQIIELRCGHFVDKERLFASLSKNCISCGESLSTRASYALQDGLKICLSCSKYELGRFKPFVLECINCAKMLMASDVPEQSEVPICKACSASQGTIQSMIEQSSAVSRHQPSSVPSVPAPKKMEEQQMIEEEPPSPPVSIVSRFSAFDIVDENPKAPSLHPKIMSKNSTEVRVQDFKLPVEARKGKQAMCDECRCFFEDKQLFQSKDPKKSGRICKVCCAEQDRFIKSRSHMTAQARMAHTSAPKKKPPVEATRPNPMKKSYMPNDNINPISSTHPLPQSTPSTAPSQQIKANTIVQSIPKDRLCEICQQKRVSIIRADKKRLCTDCANGGKS